MKEKNPSSKEAYHSLEKDSVRYKRKPPGYWQNLENFKNELQKVIKEKFDGTFPTDKMLRDAGYSSIERAIGEYYGGINKVRSFMGYRENKKSLGYWQNVENVKNELQKLIKEKFDGTFPTLKMLREAGHTSLEMAIARYHGGFYKMRELLGYENDTKSHGYWQNIEIIKNTLKKLIKENFGTFPTDKILRDAGYSSLATAIGKYHGGINKVREHMGYDIRTKTPGYWQNVENVKINLQEVIEKKFNGIFPTSTMLRDAGYSHLVKVIYDHGGMNKIRHILGFGDWIDDWDEKGRYYSTRGRVTEQIVRDLLRDWAEINGFSYSKRNETAVGNGRFLEFVCETDKVYGVDITNAKSSLTVERKWKIKKYHEQVDELWIIVVAENHKEQQFKTWNRESPENVLVIDYRKLDEFLNNISNNSIPFEIPPEKQRKLKALAECTFYNKEKIKKKYKSGKV